MDGPWPGAAHTIGDDIVEAIVVDALETAPPDATHWSSRGLAARHGRSIRSVVEVKHVRGYGTLGLLSRDQRRWTGGSSRWPSRTTMPKREARPSPCRIDGAGGRPNRSVLVVASHPPVRLGLGAAGR